MCSYWYFDNIFLAKWQGCKYVIWYWIFFRKPETFIMQRHSHCFLWKHTNCRQLACRENTEQTINEHHKVSNKFIILERWGYFFLLLFLKSTWVTTHTSRIFSRYKYCIKAILASQIWFSLFQVFPLKQPGSLFRITWGHLEPNI